MLTTEAPLTTTPGSFVRFASPFQRENISHDLP
jgi:hypothetical protein